MKVRIKTWEEMAETVIRIPNKASFTIKMERALPENRIIEVTVDDKNMIWETLARNYSIEDWMIAEYIEDDLVSNVSNSSAEQVAQYQQSWLFDAINIGDIYKSNLTGVRYAIGSKASYKDQYIIFADNMDTEKQNTYFFILDKFLEFFTKEVVYEYQYCEKVKECEWRLTEYMSEEPVNVPGFKEYQKLEFTKRIRQ